jgi:fumarylacetoacetase
VSWFPVKPTAPFGTVELPYGIYSHGGRPPRVGVALGDQVIDLAGFCPGSGQDPRLFEAPTLNPFLAAGPVVWAETRQRLVAAVGDPAGRARLEPHLIPGAVVQLHLPIEVADYVDFYASEHHASNVGQIFRPGGAPLTPNWKHMPIGYHGRSGTVVVSGMHLRRPRGQVKAPDEVRPGFGPSRKLDIEAELGWVVGTPSAPGEPVGVEDFRRHVFGVVVLNDWSARDLQAWEYVPLGPFLGKSFGTSISAWVLPLEALDDARVEPPEQQPELLPYLRPPGAGYAVEVEVRINGQLVSTCPSAGLYYTPAQMLAHLTVNGAHLRTGDLYGSGTISGVGRNQRGSLLELTWNGAEPLNLGVHGLRTFLEDGDEVVLTAQSGGASRVRLGEVRGTILPSGG